MVIIPKSAKGEVATLMREGCVPVTGVIDNAPRSDPRDDRVLVYWPTHKAFPEYIRLAPNFVLRVEENPSGEAIIHTQSCYGEGRYFNHDEEVLARRLLRKHLEGVGVGLDDLIDLFGRRTILVDAENNAKVYEGVVLHAPTNEKRAELVLAHYLGEQLMYTNIYPDNIARVNIQQIPAVVVAYDPMGGGSWFDQRTRLNAELHLKQQGLYPTNKKISKRGA